MKSVFSRFSHLSLQCLCSLLLAVGLMGQNGELPPCVHEGCVNFDDQSLHGFVGYLPCQFPSPGVALAVNSPGPSGNATDYYMHATDQSGASLIQNFTDFNGNWLCLASNGCATFCFDFRLFIDGLDGGVLSITNSFVMVSDPDGPCGPNPPLRAQWVANFAVTENGGTNEGWHKFCAPIALLQNGSLPSNSLGGWRMLDGAPNSDWTVLLANVTGLLFPIDFTSNPAEEVGYDNFCIESAPCPPSCLVVTNEKITCLTNGVYSYTFSVTNYFNGPVSWIGFVDLTNGLSVNGNANGNLVLIDPPLQTGQGTNITVTLNFTNQVPTTLCFKMTAHNFRLFECCAIDHCIELPKCCAIISEECVAVNTNAPGSYTYSFNYLNLSGLPVKYIFVTPDSNYVACFSSQVVTLATPLPNGAATNVTVTLNISSNCGPTICLNISGHTTTLEECCSERVCITLPNCCKPRTYTLNNDFDLGTLVNLNHNPSDQLQLNPIAKPFPYITVACSSRGTAARIDINTGVVLGEYWTAPDLMGRLPSRTTVDKFGNVWVCNRAESGESPALSGIYKGSVVRIGLIIGGTRGKKDSFGNFVADPTGAYIAPPYIYNTCIDRDGDGLIKTSKGLADILPWPNTAGADTHGGVSTAEDEAIQIFTRVNGTGARFIGIDCDNNVWVGGDNNQEFQKLNGFTGLPIPAFNFNLGAGGYGGLIDGSGKLWGAHGLLNFTPSTGSPPGSGVVHPTWVYGLGINPLNCHVFGSSASGYNTNYGLAEFDPAGNVINAYPAVGGGGGLVVDGNGHIWVSQQSQIAHLAPSGPGHVVVGYITTDNTSTPFGFVWGAAVDSNGKIWVTDAIRDIAVRINPALAAGLGAVDLVVPLGGGAFPYNYSDMTGFVELAATCRSGFWSILHDGCSPGNPWGKISWNGLEPAGTSLTVEVRAADAQGALPSTPWTTVKNGSSFCGGKIKGQYLEVRVSFNAPGCSTLSPILYDLTVDCCPQANTCDPTNHLPDVVKCPDPITVCNVDATGAPSPVTVNVTVSDADGDPLIVTFREGANPPFYTTNVPAGGPPTVANVGFTTTFTPGTHVIIMTINDGHGPRDVCDIIINVGDKVPPKIECPPGVTRVGFKGIIPAFLPVTLSDNCTPSNQIVVVQSPAPGGVVPAGNHTITLIATDLAGNSATCQTFFAVSPQVQIVSPAKYSDFNAPATFDVVATINTNAGPIRAINFYAGSQLLGTSSNAPYRVTATLSASGQYSLRAVAIDPEGNIAVSEIVQVTIRGTAPGTSPSPTLAIPVQDGDSVRFVIPTQSNATYYLECTDNLRTPAQTDWRIVHTISGNGTDIIVSDTTTNRAHQFYRLRVQ